MKRRENFHYRRESTFLRSASLLGHSFPCGTMPNLGKRGKLPPPPKMWQNPPKPQSKLGPHTRWNPRTNLEKT